MASLDTRILPGDVGAKRPTQQPILPWEVTDQIIDFLSTDVASLGACGAVCTEWLARSRFLLFSTVQLWPWRVRALVQLAQQPECTFSTCIRRIELDDARTRQPRAMRNGRERSLSPPRRRKGGEEDSPVVLAEAMALCAGLRCFSQLAELEIRNVDWTKMKAKERELLRVHLSGFSRLLRLEFRDVLFQDTREVARITGLFPKLQHLTADITFSKYLEHTLAEASQSPISNIVSLETGREDCAPIILSCVETPTSIRNMNLKNIRENHLRYIQQFLQSKTAAHLHNLALHFDIMDKTAMLFEDETFAALDLSSMPELRTLRIGGLPFHDGHQIVSNILSQVEAAFLLRVDLHFCLDGFTAAENALSAISCAANWLPLQNALLDLHFFGVKEVHVEVEVCEETMPASNKVETMVRKWLPELTERGVISVSVFPSRRKGTMQGSKEDTLWDDDEDDDNEEDGWICS